ncbi:MAG: hypothetical protein LBQ24_05990 [Candidatus Peribacteria bacterium]|jgi:hypothetical protein|nr:hypothetical protein [Candidatus Peribacteria bacterium]
MNVKAFVAVILSASALLVAAPALADRPNLTPEQLAKARESARQLNPPVDFDAMLEEVDRLGVECTGDLIKRIEIHLCRQKISNAKIKADTEATRKENATLIREIQQRIKENK